MPYTRAQLLAAYRNDNPELRNLSDNEAFARIAVDDPEAAKGISELQPRPYESPRIPGGAETLQAGPAPSSIFGKTAFDKARNIFAPSGILSNLIRQRTPTVASEGAENVTRGIPQAITNIPGTLVEAGRIVTSGNPMESLRRTGNMAYGVIQPFIPPLKSAFGQAPLPESPEWSQAQQGAGAMLGGAELPNVLGSPLVRGGVNLAARGAEAGARAVLPPAERLAQMAAENRALAASGGRSQGTGGVLSHPVALWAGNLLAGHTGAAIAEGLNLANTIRQTPQWANLKAGVQQTFADALRQQPQRMPLGLPYPSETVDVTRTTLPSSGNVFAGRPPEPAGLLGPAPPAPMTTPFTPRTSLPEPPDTSFVRGVPAEYPPKIPRMPASIELQRLGGQLRPTPSAEVTNVMQQFRDLQQTGAGAAFKGGLKKGFPELQGIPESATQISKAIEQDGNNPLYLRLVKTIQENVNPIKAQQAYRELQFMPKSQELLRQRLSPFGRF